jgi:hypothetical protein
MSASHLVLTWVVLASASTLQAQRADVLLPETGQIAHLHFSPASEDDTAIPSFDITSSDRRTHFVPRNPIARVPPTHEERISSGLWQTIAGAELDPSRYFFRAEYKTDSHRHTLLFFVGGGYASNAAPLLVIGFHSDGAPYKVLERNEFDPTSIQPTQQGAAIIGKSTLSQVRAPLDYSPQKNLYATTYDPFSVFVVHPDSLATYSLTLSRSYNVSHYVWAGPRSREDFAVMYNVPGHAKPFVVPASRVDALLNFAKKRTQ